ncbi:3-deoxy-D-arabino-heptulosonate 7-phosphate synthase [Bordetella sp. 02P26C-1]|uniref:3-deoxy-D-arabino-heptulosonate 7-phosphate synthase n=1 Tax=Bordetella sp. 02P26C-1 TaxID=2683195 RepID=UPI0013553655|nr:3-deoxy-D-arabino-heptulosonate 7-phosphate synthase [Bordetella sp. 02P26C-1]MVW80574.1 3-deoxy-D-arabino-heptulosonate 7-phosphate synthase [Bordetella sp. 02P26C-1]
MSGQCPILEQVLRTVERRYRIPARPSLIAAAHPAIQEQVSANGAVPATPANRIAIAIEHARAAIEAQASPSEDLSVEFCGALALLIERAAHPVHGDPAFQALLLQRQSAAVNEYVLLSAGQNDDRRAVTANINAIAHPQKVLRMPVGPVREVAERMYQQYAAEAWDKLADEAQAIVQPEPIRGDLVFTASLKRLLSTGALSRLQRLSVLQNHTDVMKYRALRARQGPLAGSAYAREQGAQARQRGDAVELRAAHALKYLAARLEALCDHHNVYRVVTSLRSPAILPMATDHAKGEWDVVLLRRSASASEASPYDLCLLIEAKASADAATGDLPRLIRGLQALASAGRDVHYACMTNEGEVSIHGASLAGWPTCQAEASCGVLYCSDSQIEPLVGLLSPGSRMQLLSCEDSLTFAARLQDGEKPCADALQPVWQQVLYAPRWQPVMQQYQSMYRAREMMVHVDDLLAAARRWGDARVQGTS